MRAVGRIGAGRRKVVQFVAHAAVNDVDTGVPGRRRVTGSRRSLFKAKFEFGKRKAGRVVAAATDSLQLTASRTK